ncbi:MAG: hypothetical protein U5L06_11680 [Rhodovibrio sp.]|nr:hypothetical protein [Rhodovibrio sp.]
MADAFGRDRAGRPSAERTRRVVGLSLDEAVARLLPRGLQDPRLATAVAAYKHAFMTRRARPDYDEPLFPGARQSAWPRWTTRRSAWAWRPASPSAAWTPRWPAATWPASSPPRQTADGGPGKPHPRHAAGGHAPRSAPAPHETLLIGDTVFDVEMAGDAGCRRLRCKLGLSRSAEELSARRRAHDPGVVRRSAHPAGEVGGMKRLKWIAGGLVVARRRGAGRRLRRAGVARPGELPGRDRAARGSRDRPGA